MRLPNRSRRDDIGLRSLRHDFGSIRMCRYKQKRCENGMITTASHLVEVCEGGDVIQNVIYGQGGGPSAGS